MALTDIQETFSRLPQPEALSDRSALSRLPEIHAEALETAQLGRFLGAGVKAAAMLMLLGLAAISFAGGGSLKQEFVWVLLVLMGVGAMLRCYIKSTARAFDRIPLREAAGDLRAVLLYTGFAWGAGAFLLLGDDPLPIMGLCFAVLPSAILIVLLRDKAASFLFLGPVTVLTGAAMLLDHWGGAPLALAMLLVVQGSIGAAVALAGRSHPALPPGLSLR